MDPTQVLRNVWAAHWVRSSLANRRAPASSRRRTPAPRARSTCLSSSARPCPTQTSACASRKTWCTAHLSIPHITSHPHTHAHTLTHPQNPHPHPHPPTHRTHPHHHTDTLTPAPTLTFTPTVSPSPPQDKLTLLTGRASYDGLTLDDLETIPQATTSARPFENPFAADRSSLINSSLALFVVPPAKITSQKQVS